MLQDVFQRFRILALRQWPVGFEDILDTWVFVVIESELDKFILSKMKKVRQVFRGGLTRRFFFFPSSWNSCRQWRRRGIRFPHQQLRDLDNKTIITDDICEYLLSCPLWLFPIIGHWCEILSTKIIIFQMKF